jgi:hypothetical protein
LWNIYYLYSKTGAVISQPPQFGNYPKGIIQMLRVRPVPSAQKKGANPHTPFFCIVHKDIKPAAYRRPHKR